MTSHSSSACDNEHIFLEIQSWKDEKISVEAQAFASEALRMADEAKEISKSIEQIKATLALLKGVSKSPPTALPITKFLADEATLFEAEKAVAISDEPTLVETDKADTMDDEATPFETDKADAIARLGASWIPVDPEPDVSRTGDAAILEETKAELSSQSTNHDSHDPSPSPPVAPSVLSQRKPHETVENLFTNKSSKDPVAVNCAMAEAVSAVSSREGSQANELVTINPTGTIGVLRDQEAKVVEIQKKEKSISEQGKVASRMVEAASVKKGALGSLPATEKKGAFESLLDAIGLDKACGIDDATLAQYAEENNTPTIRATPRKQSSKVQIRRALPSYRMNDSFTDGFGFTNDIDLVFCGDIESEIENFNELQVFYSLPVDDAQEVGLGSVSKHPKSILKSPDKDPKEKTPIETKQVEEPQGVQLVEADPVEEEIEKKSVCFQGAEPDGIKAESFQEQSFQMIEMPGTVSAEIMEAIVVPKVQSKTQQKRGKLVARVGREVIEDEVDLVEMLDGHLSCI